MLNGIRKIFVRLRRDERGATLVEYGIALVLAIIVGGGALMTLASGTVSNFDDASDAAADRTP